MLIQLDMYIVVIILDLILVQNFYLQMEAMENNGKNIIIFGTEIRSSVHIHNKNKHILILGEGPTQGIDDTTLTAEAKHPIILHHQEKDLY